MKALLPTFSREGGRSWGNACIRHWPSKRGVFVSLLLLFAALAILMLSTKYAATCMTTSRSTWDPRAIPMGSSGGTLSESQLQEAFCELIHPIEYPGIVAVNAVSVPGHPEMYVYNSSDIVSQHIIKEGAWENRDVAELVWAMQQPLPVVQGFRGSSRAASAHFSQGSDLFVDVGANLGWFSINVAAAGFQVAAFEGMRRNQQLIRSTLCANPGLAKNIVLYPMGLGASTATCFIFSDSENTGDGHTNCNATDVVSATRDLPQGYKLRGTMPVQRLDKVLAGRDIKAMKVDVEGYELHVLQGAEDLFKNHNVWFLLVEFNYDMTKRTLNGAHPKEFPRFIASLGMRISFDSFKGPFINASSEEQLEALTTVAHARSRNLFCVNEKYFALQQGKEDQPGLFRSAEDIFKAADLNQSQVELNRA